MLGKYFDAFCAAVLLLTSSGLAAFSYRHLQTEDALTQVALGKLPAGSAHSLVISGSRCVGVLETLNERLELTRLRADARISANAGGREVPVHFEVEGFFNPMGQLVRSSARIQADGAMFALTATDVHPITANVSVSAPGGVAFGRSFELPGPILLAKNGDDWTLEYPQLRELVPASFRNVSFLLPSDNSALSLEPAARGADCPPERRGSFDGTEMTARVFRMFPQLAEHLGVVPKL